MSMKAATLDLSITLENPLYANCEIEEVAGQQRLKATPEDAVNIIGRNAETIVKRLMSDGVESLTLTGRSAIWVYLVVFHAAVHRFREVYYDDGKPSGKVRIAAH
jgi:hypothetical protein